MSLTPDQIGERRIIERIVIASGNGELWLNGKIERFRFDDVVDLAEMGEVLLLKHSGKVLRRSLRPSVINRAACQPDVVIAGDASMYDGHDAPYGSAAGWYMRIEIDGQRWDNWFTRLDEWVRLLYIVIREAQGTPYQPKPSIMVPGAVGHA